MAKRDKNTTMRDLLHDACENLNSISALVCDIRGTKNSNWNLNEKDDKRSAKEGRRKLSESEHTDIIAQDDNGIPSLTSFPLSAVPLLSLTYCFSRTYGMDQ